MIEEIAIAFFSISLKTSSNAVGRTDVNSVQAFLFNIGDVD